MYDRTRTDPAHAQQSMGLLLAAGDALARALAVFADGSLDDVTLGSVRASAKAIRAHAAAAAIAIPPGPPYDM
jgi:hypothetical protein